MQRRWELRHFVWDSRRKVYRIVFTVASVKKGRFFSSLLFCRFFSSHRLVRPHLVSVRAINVYLFIYTFSLTHLQVRPVDGFSSLMAQTTRTRARMCILGVSLILLLIFGGEIPKTQFFGRGMNRRFQAKRAIYWKFHFIKTTASILTKSKFGLTIETTKESSWVVRIGAQQIQDGGRPPFWKKNIKSPYLCDRSTDFDEIWHADSHWSVAADQSLKCRIFENPRWQRPPSWKITKIAISPQRFDWFLRNLVSWCKMRLATAQTVKKLNLKNPRWRTAAILTTAKSPYLCNLLTDCD